MWTPPPFSAGAGRTVAVSYTHLDVYKRQVLVLRKGNVAVRVFAPVNLTDRDILAAIRSRSGF